MATKQTRERTSPKSSSRRKPAAKSTRARTTKRKTKRGGTTRTRTRIRHDEPVAARVMQAMLLLAGMLLLFSVLLGPTIGPLTAGALIFVTAIPPVRGPVDEWLVGARRGARAQQAAAMRMAAGVLTMLLALLGVLRLGV